MLVQIPTTRWCEAYGAGEKRSGFECLPECADMPFHYLFNSLWIPQRRGEDRRPCQGGKHALNVRVASSSATVDIIIIIKNKQIKFQSSCLKIAR